MEPNIYKYNKRFELESGHVLPCLEIAYHTYGKLSSKMDNIIWVCHALTANSEVDQWWPHTVEEGKFLDPKKNFVICANMLGSPYGTTSPMSVNPVTGEKYYGSFPKITVRDMVRVHMILAEYLGIDSVSLLIGSSIGGFQVSEWLVMYPKFAKKGILIATAAKAYPWVIAFNESQRMAIESDCTFGERRENAAEKGLATARSIALLSYRGQPAYDITQQDVDDPTGKLDNFRASSYQRYQGEKLIKRFNAYSYYRLTQTIDSHNLARGRGSIENALKSIKAKVSIIAITSDILYPISSHFDFHQYIPSCEFNIIESDFGHDGFLIEHEKLDNIISRFLAE